MDIRRNLWKQYITGKGKNRNKSCNKSVTNDEDSCVCRRWPGIDRDITVFYNGHEEMEI